MSIFKKLCLISGLILLAACTKAGREAAIENAIEKESGGNADVNINNDGSMHIETSEGTYDAGSNRLPADWPTDVTAYAGATIQYSGSTNPATGKAGAAAVLMTADKPEKVVEFYKADLRAKGWTIATTMQGQGTNILGATKGNRALSIMVAGSPDDQTSITIGVGQQ